MNINYPIHLCQLILEDRQEVILDMSKENWDLLWPCDVTRCVIHNLLFPEFLFPLYDWFAFVLNIITTKTLRALLMQSSTLDENHIFLKIYIWFEVGILDHFLLVTNILTCSSCKKVLVKYFASTMLFFFFFWFSIHVMFINLCCGRESLFHQLCYLSIDVHALLHFFISRRISLNFRLETWWELFTRPFFRHYFVCLLTFYLYY